MRKTIIVFAAAAALGAGAGMADARTGGMGGGAGHAMVGGGIGHGMVGGHFAGPMVGGGTRGFSGRAFTTSRAHIGTLSTRTNFTRTAFFHDRFHRFHHHRNFFFDVGFAAPFVAGTSCWQLIWTGWGWQRVWVCDWPY